MCFPVIADCVLLCRVLSLKLVFRRLFFLSLRLVFVMWCLFTEANGLSSYHCSLFCALCCPVNSPCVLFALSCHLSLCCVVVSLQLCRVCSCSGSNTSVGEEGAYLFLSITCNYMVSVREGFLFLLVLGMGCVMLLWHSLPYNNVVWCPVTEAGVVSCVVLSLKLVLCSVLACHCSFCCVVRCPFTTACVVSNGVLSPKVELFRVLSCH